MHKCRVKLTGVMPTMAVWVVDGLGKRNSMADAKVSCICMVRIKLYSSLMLICIHTHFVHVPRRWWHERFCAQSIGALRCVHTT